MEECSGFTTSERPHHLQAASPPPSGLTCGDLPWKVSPQEGLRHLLRKGLLSLSPEKVPDTRLSPPGMVHAEESCDVGAVVVRGRPWACWCQKRSAGPCGPLPAVHGQKRSHPAVLTDRRIFLSGRDREEARTLLGAHPCDLAVPHAPRSGAISCDGTGTTRHPVAGRSGGSRVGWPHSWPSGSRLLTLLAPCLASGPLDAQGAWPRGA